jgi:septum formation protein
VQGRAAAFITRLSGSHAGVMGLPVHAVAAMLAQANITMAP